MSRAPFFLLSRQPPPPQSPTLTAPAGDASLASPPPTDETSPLLRTTDAPATTTATTAPPQPPRPRDAAATPTLIADYSDAQLTAAVRAATAALIDQLDLSTIEARRHFRDQLVFFSCAALLIGLTPFSIYVFLHSNALATLYLDFSPAIHIALQIAYGLLCVIIISLQLSREFILRMTDPDPWIIFYYVFVVYLGATYASTALDEVAVYLNAGHYDSDGAFVKGPADTSAPNFSLGTSPDSPIFIVMFIIATILTCNAAINLCHYAYFCFFYPRPVTPPTIIPMQQLVDDFV